MEKIDSIAAGGVRGPLLTTNPFSVRVPQALAMTGFSRSRLYELIKSGEIQIAKDGNCTLILVESLRAAVERRIVHRRDD